MTDTTDLLINPSSDYRILYRYCAQLSLKTNESFSFDWFWSRMTNNKLFRKYAQTSVIRARLHYEPNSE